MDWGNITKLENDAIIVPDRWLHLHYYEALNVLFRVENSLRMLVYVALKNEYRDKWTRTSLSSEDGETTISAIANKRRSQASTFGYLTYPVTSPLMYITTGELTKIIETQWELFRPYFLGGKEIVSMKLAEIISVRNSFAHFRPIKSDDVETIKQLSKHVLTAAEKELAEMLDPNNTVPTNTPEKWYTDLKLLNSKHVKMSFAQSTNEKWITICLMYQPPITTRNTYGGNRSFGTMKFHSPALLSEHRELASNLTYVTEWCIGIAEKKGSKEKIEKWVYLGFNRKTLQDNHAEIQSEITSLLSKIEEETELIKEDNLARGKLISAVVLTEKVEQGRKWSSFDTSAMESGFKEDDPPEWWGEMQVYVKDLISGTHLFPGCLQVLPRNSFRTTKKCTNLTGGFIKHRKENTILLSITCEACYHSDTSLFSAY